MHADLIWCLRNGWLGQISLVSCDVTLVLFPKRINKVLILDFRIEKYTHRKNAIKLLFTSFTQGQSQAINTLLCELMNGFDDKPGLTKKIVSICLWKLIKIYWLKALMFASFRSFICFHSPATICHRWIVPKMFSMRLIPMNDSN